VAAAWSWWNAVELDLGGESAFIKINLDETAVRLFPGAAAGVQMPDPTGQKRAPLIHGFPVAKKLQRACMSHVAFVSDRADVQAVLPQLFMVSARVCTLQDAQEIEQRLPPHYYFIRDKSHWVTDAVLCTFLRLVSVHLREAGFRQRIALIMDTCPSHMTWRVFFTMKECGMVPVLVPARLTPLMQPLDVFVFAKYKRRLQNEFVRVLLAQGTNDFSVKTIVRIASETWTQTARQVSSPRIFETCGYGGFQTTLTTRLTRVSYGTGLRRPAPPRLDQAVVQACCPRGRYLPLDAVLVDAESEFAVLRAFFCNHLPHAGLSHSHWRSQLRHPLAAEQ